MAIKNYGIYYQGAMFTKEDFDVAKVIIKLASETDMELSFSKKQSIQTNTVDWDLINELCERFGVNQPEEDEMNAYKFLSDQLLNDIEEWMDDCDCEDCQPVLGTENVIIAEYISEIEGEFIYSDLNQSRKNITECYIFAFHTPLAWKHDDDCFPKNIDEAVSMLRNAGKKLLKDDIDWKSRLGELIGSAFGEAI